MQLLGRASVKKEFRLPPTKNRFADRTPSRFCRYFADNDPWLVSGRISKRDVTITVPFGFYGNHAARENGQKRRQTLSRHANLLTKVGL
jgi:hypothetical protein